MGACHLLSKAGLAMMRKQIISALRMEFVCWYHGDLLPHDWPASEVIHKMAKSTAGRLCEENLRREDLIDLLEEMRSSRHHAVNKALSDETDMDWCDEDDGWGPYHELLTELLRQLRE